MRHRTTQHAERHTERVALLRPERGIVLECIGPDALEHRWRCADVSHDEFATEALPRLQQVSWLLAEAGHREHAAHRAQIRPGVAHQSAGHVDCNDLHLPGRGLGQGLCRRALQSPAQAGSEDRVDDQSRAVQCGRTQGLDRPAPKRCVMGRCAAKLLAWDEACDTDRPVGLRQAARGHEAITSVAARAAQHDQRTRPPALHDGLCHRAAGILHQRVTTDAGHHRQSIGLGHLDGSEQRHPPVVLRHGGGAARRLRFEPGHAPSPWGNRQRVPPPRPP